MLLQFIWTIRYSGETAGGMFCCGGIMHLPSCAVAKSITEELGILT